MHIWGGIVVHCMAFGIDIDMINIEWRAEDAFDT
jgi:hypothetical protein